MNSPITKILVFITFLSFTISCVDKKSDITRPFPLSEKVMLENKGMIGTLLEYAIYDSSKIDFVKKNICDSLKNSDSHYFRKYETIINDSMHFFYVYENYQYGNIDYFNIVHYFVNNPDTFYVYSKNHSFNFNDFDKLIKLISEHENQTPIQIIKNSKIGKCYVPNIIFVVWFDSFDCSSDFIENVIKTEKIINELFRKYCNKNFAGDSFLISPDIELKKYNGW